MSIERADFDSIEEKDLQELIDAQVPESLRLEYKLKEYGNSDSDKKELLKDISAFANTHGGHLVLGIQGNKGIASKLVGIEIDTDAEILRIEQITRNGIEPKISGIRIKAVSLTTSRKVLVVRVPRSWSPPHRVTANGANRFYIRNSAGVHEASIDELRILFNLSATALGQARRFRDERIQFAIEGKGERPLEAGGRLFLHIIPTAAFTGIVNLDMEKVFQQKDCFWPLGDGGLSPGFNFYGYVSAQSRSGKNYGYTQVFRNGILEATKTAIVFERDKKYIAGVSEEQSIFSHLLKYISGLKIIGVPPPFIIMFTFEGVKGAFYCVGQHSPGYIVPSLPESILALPECFLEDFGSDIDYHRAVRPAFDALWNACGYSRSQHFNKDGLWVGEQST